MTGDKRITMQTAVDLVPAEGARLAFGGVTLYRRPMAFSLALVERFGRQGAPRDLTLVSFTAGVESDVLVGAGMVKRLRSCYFGLEAFGLAPHFTAAAGQGSIEIIEETEASLASGIRATLAGIGFMPSTAWIGTDLPKLRPDVKTVVDPYTGETLTAFPAFACDVAVIHALVCDPEGNASIGGNWGVDRELAMIAGTVIVTAERIVDRLQTAEIAGPAVTAVVEAPGGAWPTSCHPDYPMDGLAVLAYAEAAGTDRYPDLIRAWHAHHARP